MKRLIQRMKCLLGYHNPVVMQGHRVVFTEDGGYETGEVEYRVCKDCEKKTVEVVR